MTFCVRSTVAFPRQTNSFESQAELPRMTRSLETVSFGYPARIDLSGRKCWPEVARKDNEDQSVF